VAKNNRNWLVIIIRDPIFWSLRSTKRSVKKIKRYDLSESKVSIPTSKKGGGFLSFEMVDYEIFRFVYSFFIELSCVYFDTYKRSPKEFFYTCSIYVYFDSNENECSEETSIKLCSIKIKLCSRKRGFLRFCPPAEKAFRLIS